MENTGFLVLRLGFDDDEIGRGWRIENFDLGGTDLMAAQPREIRADHVPFRIALGVSGINGNVENSVIFKQVYVGNNCTIKNSIILNDVHIGDNTYLENCIVESRDTLRPGTNYVGSEEEIKIVIEKNVRYIL